MTQLQPRLFEFLVAAIRCEIVQAKEIFEQIYGQSALKSILAIQSEKKKHDLNDSKKAYRVYRSILPKHAAYFVLDFICTFITSPKTALRSIRKKWLSAHIRGAFVWTSRKNYNKNLWRKWHLNLALCSELRKIQNKNVKVALNAFFESNLNHFGTPTEAFGEKIQQIASDYLEELQLNLPELTYSD